MRLFVQTMGKLPSGIKGDMKKMYEAYEQALANVTEKFADLIFILMIAFCLSPKVSEQLWRLLMIAQYEIGAGHIYYTPVEASFQAIGTEGIVFHGTGDDWAKTEVISAECRKEGCLYI